MIIIIGIAKNRKVINKIKLPIKNKYFRLLPLNLKLLNFKENNSIFEFNRKALSNVKPTKNH